MELQLKYKGNDYAKIREMVINAYDDIAPTWRRSLQVGAVVSEIEGVKSVKNGKNIK